MKTISFESVVMAPRSFDNVMESISEKSAKKQVQQSMGFRIRVAWERLVTLTDPARNTILTNCTHRYKHSKEINILQPCRRLPGTRLAQERSIF